VKLPVDHGDHRGGVEAAAEELVDLGDPGTGVVDDLVVVDADRVEVGLRPDPRLDRLQVLAMAAPISASSPPAASPL